MRRAIFCEHAVANVGLVGLTEAFNHPCPLEEGWRGLGRPVEGALLATAVWLELYDLLVLATGSVYPEFIWIGVCALVITGYHITPNFSGFSTLAAEEMVASMLLFPFLDALEYLA